MSIRASLLASLAPPLPERDCKGTTFSRTPSSRTGLQRYYFFLSLQIFSQLFSDFFFAPGTGHRPAGSRTTCPARSCATPAPGRIFPVPEQENCSQDRQATAHRKEHAQHGRSSMCSTGGTQSKGCRGCQSGKRLTSGRVGTVSLRRILALQRDPAPRAMPTLWRMSALHRKEDRTVRSGPPAR